MTSAGLWSTFTAAPHRVMFFGGAVQALTVMLWWLLELATRYGIVGHPIAWMIAPGAAHAYLMIYGVLPFFMFGFLMTVFPRWMGGQEIPARHYVPAFLLLVWGNFGFYAGLLAGKIMLGVTLSATLAGWATVLYALLQVLRDTRQPDKQHPKVILVALSLGWCSLAAYLIGLSFDDPVFLRIATQGGLWLFLLPVFASVVHRMLPFFTRSALPDRVVNRPDWPWWTILAGSVAHGLMQFASLPGLTWLADLPMALAALYLSYLWGLRRSLHIPLLGVLHIGFAWLGIATLMFSIQSLASFLDGTHIWGLAPLHALTLGCFATLVIGMGTRVTLGHSGRPMNVDTPVVLMFAGIQMAAIVRVLADVLATGFSYWLYVAAAIVWLAVFFPWARRHLPFYWRPRADGQPG